MDGTMAEHLTLERISALLDEPWADLEAERHLERCDGCRAEYERLSRMRMAMSVLGELEPPPGAWSRIEARLGDPAPPPAVPLRRRVARRFLASWPLQAAAAAVLFAAGVTAGVRFVAPGPGDPSGALADLPGERGADVPVVVPPTGSDAALLTALAELEALRSPVERARASLERTDGTVDPIVATRWIARLDGAIRAMQESVDRSPGDPVANAYLFRLLDERDRLTGQLRQSVHLAQAAEW